jgi:hypothetical protein
MQSWKVAQLLVDHQPWELFRERYASDFEAPTGGRDTFAMGDSKEFQPGVHQSVRSCYSQEQGSCLEGKHY